MIISCLKVKIKNYSQFLLLSLRNFFLSDNSDIIQKFYIFLQKNIMQKFFSLSVIMQKLSLVVRRFPVSILLVAGFAVLCFIEINNNSVPKNAIPYQLWIFFSVGALISVALTLWLENYKICLWRYALTLAGVLLWSLYCWFLPENEKDMIISTNIQVFVVGCVSILATLFISFFGKNREKAFWQFTVSTLFYLVVSALFSFILWGGLSLALMAINELFSININDDMYKNLAVICYCLFLPIYFLANIPDKIEKFNEEIFINKILKIFVLYILIPILMTYAVILYAYLFKIIATWELPNGWVSWLVSILSFGGLLIITMLYPFRLQGNKFVSFLTRFFGIIILPLIMLMTIGIFRRISDYGITINRCYVLLLNLWFYGIFAYIFITKALRIKWIIISFSIIAVVSSFGFWSVSNITKNYLTKELHNYLGENKFSSYEKQNAFIDNFDKKQKKRIYSDLTYLRDYYDDNSIQPFFTDSISNSYYALSRLGLDDDIVTVESIEPVKSEYFYFYNYSENIINIENYNRCLYIDYNKHIYNKYENMSFVVDNQNFTIKLKNENTSFIIPYKKIITENRKKTPKTIIYNGENFIFNFDNLSGDYHNDHDSVKLDYFKGYLFYNQCPPRLKKLDTQGNN